VRWPARTSHTYSDKSTFEAQITGMMVFWCYDAV
jgi:hypothetical protein